MHHLKKVYVIILIMVIGVGLSFANDGQQVYIGGRQLDLKTQTAAATIAGEKGHLLIQFSRPIAEQENQKLAELGVTLHQYLPEDAYFATIKKVQLETVKSLDFVYGVGNVAPQDKLAYGIRKKLATADKQAKLAVLIYFYPDVSAEEQNKVLSRFVIFSTEKKTKDDSSVLLTIEQLEQLANQDIVYQIWPKPSPKIPFNRDAADTSDVDQIQPGGSSDYNLTGAGIILGEWDEASVRRTHLDFATNRVIQKDSPTSMSGHSTHVAGTIVGNGTTAWQAMGMSYQATLWAYDWDNDTAEMKAAASSIAASNHSYGYIRGWYYDGIGYWWLGDTAVNQNEDYLFGKYISDSHDWDNLVKETDLVICKAAGNDRGDSMPSSGTPHKHWDSDSPPYPLYTDTHYADNFDNGGFDTEEGAAVAKNVITVGAVNDITIDPFTTSDIVMPSFSSWGPVDDGRIKPDICTDGVGLYSTYTTSDSAHASMSGTSMATPVVTGTVGLLTQLYKQKHGSLTKPFAAEMKAILIHTAFESGTTAGPDYRFGWGLMNGRGAADLMVSDATTVSDTKKIVNGTYNGSTVTYLRMSDGTQPIKVTLVWTDPAGAPNTGGLDDSTKALVNDLNLTVITPSASTKYPWSLNRLNPNNPATATGANHIDNVEQVEIALGSVQVGQYQIRVSHTGSITGGTQPYAIIMTGFVHVTGVSHFELYE